MDKYSQAMLAAFSDEFEKISANFNFLSETARNHAKGLKALGGVRRAKALQSGAQAAAGFVPKPIPGM
jgi:hypothetical protein